MVGIVMEQLIATGPSRLILTLSFTILHPWFETFVAPEVFRNIASSTRDSSAPKLFSCAEFPGYRLALYLNFKVDHIGASSKQYLSSTFFTCIF